MSTKEASYGQGSPDVSGFLHQYHIKCSSCCWGMLIIDSC